MRVRWGWCPIPPVHGHHRPRSREGALPSRISTMWHTVTPMGSAAIRATVGRPQGRHNPPAGTGCSQKRMPAAERHGEIITRRIGHLASLKGRRRGAGVSPEDRGNGFEPEGKLDASSNECKRTDGTVRLDPSQLAQGHSDCEEPETTYLPGHQGGIPRWLVRCLSRVR